MSRSHGRAVRAVAALVACVALAACGRPQTAPIVPADERVVVVLQGDVGGAQWHAHVVAEGADDSAAVAALGNGLQAAAARASPARGAVVDAVFDALGAAGRADLLVLQDGVVRARGRNAAGAAWSIDVDGARVLLDEGAAVVGAGAQTIRGGTATEAAAAAGRSSSGADGGAG